jgi:hypothetical protein
VSLILLSRGRGTAASGGNAFLANLPIGMTEVYDTSFESSPLANPYEGIEMGIYGGSTEGAALTSNTLVASSGGFGSQALRCRFAEGSLGGGNGTILINTPNNLASRALYMAMRMRFSAGYRFHANGEKLLYPVHTTTNSIGGLVNIGASRQLIGLTYAGEVGLDITANNIIPVDTWFTLEIYLRMNTPSTSDGIRRIWLDGTQIVNESSAIFDNVSGSQATFRILQWEDTRGGGNDTVGVPTGGQWRELDRLAVYKEV